MRRLVTIFLFAFLLDAALTVALGVSSPFQSAVALAVLFASVGLAVATAFTPRLPKTLLLPPALFLVWASICGAFPLSFLELPNVMELLGFVQCGLGLLLLALHLFVLRHWPERAMEKRAFSWVNLLGMTLLSVLLAPLLLAAATLNSLGIAAETGTAGYLKFRPEGLVLAEREFEKDGKRVRLVGMMHIGDRNFYRSVQESFEDPRPTVVLLEGVTDSQGLLSKGLSYSPIADKVGLVAQNNDLLIAPAAPVEPDGASSSDPEFRQADIDVSSFRPETIEVMNAMGVFFENPTIETAIETFGTKDSPLQRPGIEEVLLEDVLTNRNAHLARAIQTALQEFDLVIVPWGALHLPEMQAILEEWGFVETSETNRPVIRLRDAPAEAPANSPEPAPSPQASLRSGIRDVFAIDSEAVHHEPSFPRSFARIAGAVRSAAPGCTAAARGGIPAA